MSKLITFDDVLIVPKFSDINSRSEVSLKSVVGSIFNEKIYNLPIMSSCMDTVTGPRMTRAMRSAGGIGCLHRFWSIEDNVRAFKEFPDCIVSVGIGQGELDRVAALYAAGAKVFLIDVAHGAQEQVCKFYNKINDEYGVNIDIILGSFATYESIRDTQERLDSEPILWRVGIGPSGVCTTRTTTGVGYPQFSAIRDTARGGRFNILADGGMRTPGDIAKALGVGAKLVMLGGMLSGTDEVPIQGVFRGSASRESYEVQGKVAHWRAYEGVSVEVGCKGPVSGVLQQIEGGLRSALTYVGARNLKEFAQKCEFVEVSQNTVIENSAHAKGNK